MHHPTDMGNPYDIQERSFLFACDLVDFCRPLVTGHPLVRELARQLLKSGTSVGANLEEADAGESKPDFRHKIALRLIAYADKRLAPGATPLVQEASELVAILTTIRKNSGSDGDRGS